ncbi:9-O-acetylesterase [Candidatus Sumerlaeota bacterium]|nr:9-O-acetylesterase [Candidatus Sumerlaeota bacterium]
MKQQSMRQSSSLAAIFALLAVLAAGCGRICLPGMAKPNAENLRFAKIFGDHMVLQQEKTVPVWGWSDPGGVVQVTLARESLEESGERRLEPLAADLTRADCDGKWMAWLELGKAGGPYVLIAQGQATIELRDVMIGEVWLCGGEANMELPVSAVVNSQIEVSKAHWPDIRIIELEDELSPEPKDDLKGSTGWSLCTPNSVREFSAVGYFYGRELHRRLNVPIGLIDCSVPRSPAETWTSCKSLLSHPDYRDEAQRWIKFADMPEKHRESFLDQRLKSWIRQLDKRESSKDKTAKRWRRAEFDDSNWKTFNEPYGWKQAPELAQFDGAVWIRRVVALSGQRASQAAMLLFERGIDDLDMVWINGHYIGGTMDVNQEWTRFWNVPRRYSIPLYVLQPGPNVIAIRVIDLHGDGGLTGESGDNHILFEDGSDVSISGEWKYRISLPLTELPKRPQTYIHSLHTPGALFNGMIHPLLPFAIRGAIWYQGEENTDSFERAAQYRSLFPLMLRDWRANFGQGDFPLLYVQLANFKERQAEPGDSPWALLREAQLLTLNEPETAMAVTIDIGESNEINPRNKQDAAQRLTLAARKLVYDGGPYLVASGPLYRSVQFERDGKARLSFDSVGSGLVAQGNNGKLAGFAIAGADGKFVWADARIEGRSVVVSSTQITQPAAVRYGWADNPQCNLYNAEGLPASPFRTDAPRR